MHVFHECVWRQQPIVLMHLPQKCIRVSLCLPEVGYEDSGYCFHRESRDLLTDVKQKSRQVTAKQVNKNVLHTFNISKTVENRLILSDQRQIYKNLIRKKKRNFKLKKGIELENLRVSRPKELWKHFSKRKNVNSTLSINNV